MFQSSTDASFQVAKDLEIPGYTVLQVLGVGAFSTVYMAAHKLTQHACALKVIEKHSVSKQQMEVIQREINIMKKLNFIFIVNLFDVVETEKYVCIAMQMADKGNLLQLVNENGRLPEREAKIIFSELVIAIQYMTSKNIVHRDIKLENILIGSRYHISLSDFGLSNEITTEDNLLTTSCGSPPYVSPEMVLHQPHNFKTDIWSAGIVLYTMVTGKFPFNGHNIGALFNKILLTEPEYPEYLSDDLVDLMKNLFKKDQNERFTTEQIFSHPWINEETDYVRMTESIRKSTLPLYEQAFSQTLKLMKVSEEELLNMLKDQEINPTTATFRMCIDMQQKKITAIFVEMMKLEEMLNSDSQDIPIFKRIVNVVECMKNDAEKKNEFNCKYRHRSMTFNKSHYNCQPIIYIPQVNCPQTLISNNKPITSPKVRSPHAFTTPKRMPNCIMAQRQPLNRGNTKKII